MTDSHTFTLEAENESRTASIAAAIAGLADAGDVIALAGDLGSGKSVFARAFIYALGGSGDVPSPTFTLVQMYELAPANVFHFDLYRLEKPEDALELDMDEAFHGGISLIEWPERLGPHLPAERLDVAFAYGAAVTSRKVRLTGHGTWKSRLENAGLV